MNSTAPISHIASATLYAWNPHYFPPKPPSPVTNGGGLQGIWLMPDNTIDTQTLSRHDLTDYQVEMEIGDGKLVEGVYNVFRTLRGWHIRVSSRETNARANVLFGQSDLSGPVFVLGVQHNGSFTSIEDKNAFMTIPIPPSLVREALPLPPVEPPPRIETEQEPLYKKANIQNTDSKDSIVDKSCSNTNKEHTVDDNNTCSQQQRRSSRVRKPVRKFSP